MKKVYGIMPESRKEAAKTETSLLCNRSSKIDLSLSDE